jgi:solute:Na+ symporter, SSS family
MSQISTLDVGIIVLYACVVLAIGAWVSRKIGDSDDYFLAGRSLGFGVIGFSLFASNISSTTLVGLAGEAYRSGIAIANYEWMAGVLFLFMAFVTAPVYFDMRLTTVPEYLERRFDARSRRYFSALTVFLSILVDTAGSIYAGSLILQVFFPTLPLVPTCFALAFFAGLYTVAGGLRAVVYTDVIQAVVLLVGSGFLTWIIFADHGFSWARATAGLPEGHLSLIRPIEDPNLPWLGTLIGVPVLGYYYWSTNQYIAQRMLAAKSLDHSRWALTLAGLLKLTPLFVMVLPGAMAVSLLPDIERPDEVFPTLVRSFLPSGVRGLVLAGLVAAIMSTIDSTLNSASTLIYNDFMGEAYKAKLGTEGAVRAGRITTLLLMVVAAAWAPMIDRFPGIFAYLQEMFSYAVPPVVAIFLLGMFWRRTTPQAALATLVFGHALGVTAFLTKQAGALALHFTIVAGVTTAVCAAFCALVSAFTTPRDPASIELALWRSERVAPDRDHPWYADYRVQVSAVAGLTLLMVLAFW